MQDLCGFVQCPPTSLPKSGPMSVSNESAHPSADKQGTLGNPMKFKGQDFELLRNLCLISGYRFRDGIFPSNMDSIGPDLLTAEELSRVEWVRPGSQHKNPHLFVHGVSRFDIHQGKVGNCWFLAALGSLTFVPRIMNNVIPSGQGFTQKYVGIFHFRFWRFGKWMDIVIDDKLPTLDGRYLFVGPANGNEFWPALLEKAYAKVCGSYSDLHSGLISEALVDFTGGVHISFNLTKPREDLWEIMQRAAAHESLMGSGSHSEPGVKPVNTVLKNGLVQAHAYAVTGVNMVHCGNKNVKLVRLWNPWGNTEWNGSWSDKSPEWNNVDPETRKLLLRDCDNGEFWMAMEDFTANFTQIDICNVYPHFLDSGNDCIWAMSEHNGSWIKGTSAGGSLKEDTFWKNPQYRVNLKTAHLDCSSSTSFNFVVYLMQKLANKHRKQSLRLHIGFSIFKVPPSHCGQKEKFSAEFFSSHQPIPSYNVGSLGVIEFFQLEPGEYLIVPSSYNKDQECDFFLSMYSKTNHKEKMDSDLNLQFSQLSVSHVNSGKKVFAKYSSQGQEINANDLQRLLNDSLKGQISKTGGLSFDACKGILAVMDLNANGKLNTSEFEELWKKITHYQEIFNQCDEKSSGLLNLHEMKNAILASGIKLSDHLLDIVIQRHTDSSDKINLESFLCLMLRLRSMTKRFRQRSHDGIGIYLQEEEWMFYTMYS